jgi:hypothetical protein
MLIFGIFILRAIFFLMTLKIDIFPFFVLFSCKNLKQKDPDQFFREMSHLKDNILLHFLALLLFMDHEF